MHSFDKVERSKVLQNSQTSLSMVSLEDKGKKTSQRQTSVLILSSCIEGGVTDSPSKYQVWRYLLHSMAGARREMGGYK